MTRTMALSEARQTLPALIARLRRLMERTIITRNGRPEAVLMGIDEYESWVETLELVSSRRTLQGIRRGLADLRSGRARSFEQVFGEPLHGQRPKR